ncbi:MAG: glycoside hydrolase/phage tail family protein, partial [Alphaproteobacteria bacterium]|nr:glycoside hydrolase/phage tail family protein [Alphaproteobacteria bacterium]
MAQLVLSNLGSALGAQVLPQGLSAFGMQVSGAAIGQAIGSLAGSAIDARYLTPATDGPRVKDFHVTESREGASIPVVYGRMRVGGQVIWAAEFKERRTSGGGKGGPRTTDYSYSLSFAAALCEGEIARVSRCWANGEAFDLSKVTWRLYRGTEDQTPDPLIEAVEGAGEAPAYRGLAYIVFEDLPVDRFGSRMPQFSFEVVRPAGGGAARLEAMTRAVNVIPGSGEFALATDIVRRVTGPGRETAENVHSGEAVPDFEASIEQLAAELPGVTRVNLVVAWFGDDLRCGSCRIRPGVEIAGKVTKPWSWSVAGVSRGAAYVVSAADGRPNYGGTPADESVRQAVVALKARGYHVTLYPFLMMDVPAGNGLPDPHGGPEQAAFPWRGRITCHPAPGRAATVDGGAAATSQVAAFFAGAEGYRAFILHYAGLAAEHGANGLLIGSEMVGLTRVRDAAGGYPAVEALRVLAGDVRNVAGSGVEISYAADWTEYGAHVRGGGADVTFPLDALWADEAVDYVGLDWYAPMTDWRDGEEHADAGFGDGRSLEYLGANVAGGEAFDWYYADADGRAEQERLAITDGAYGEPFVFRQKDVRGWWSSPHHVRAGGVRSAAPTGWAPGMKPLRFVEFGCPAIDKGANQPNVFYDPKSSESALPHYSDGSRDDLVQRRSIEAFLGFWADDANNPLSEDYDGRMVPDDGAAVWAWDARPYPAFPARDDVWSDSGNWRLGHWLNGRVGLALLGDVVGDISARAGCEADVSGLAGIVSGYRFDGPASARRVLEPLALAYGIDAVERDGVIAFQMRDGAAIELDTGDLVEGTDGQSLELTRGGMEAAEVAVRLRFVDAEADHAAGVVTGEAGADADIVDVELAVAMDRGQARRIAREIAGEITQQRDRARFALAGDGVRFEAGDVVGLADGAFRIVETSDAEVIRFEAVRAGASRKLALVPALPVSPPLPSPSIEPEVIIVDGPALPGEEHDARPLGFAFAAPWTGTVNLSAGADATLLTVRGRINRPCAIGRLESGLYPHVSGRWQDASVWVKCPLALESRTDAAVLNGGNGMLVETLVGWEFLQFRDAELVDVETYRLSRLLRGQQGSELAMQAGASVGSRIVVLTGAETRLEVADWERGLELVWRGWRDSPDEAVAWGEMFS